VPLRADRFGLSVALATPVAEDRSIDLPRFVAHGLQSPADGCDSLTVFGTAGEGASLGRRAPLRSLSDAECRNIFAAVDGIRAKRAA
jgi:4-hydroxy-tetrahydrodipicolinate synthase